MPKATPREAQLLGPYLPNLVASWLTEQPEALVRELDGSVVFVDISGFTRMSERLGRHGKVGAEEVTQTIGDVFARLLTLAYADNGGLLKFGGDALLLLFEGDAHEVRAARAATGMRAALREIGPIKTSAGRVVLRMSVGVHSGRFAFFLVGHSHRELVVAGPAVTETVLMESIAEAGEIVVSAATAACLPPRCLGAARGSGMLLRRAPDGPERHLSAVPAARREGDLLSCIPVALRGHLLDGALDPEHRRVTVAFARFGGFDPIAVGRGLDAAASRLQELMELIQESADRNGVTFLGTDIDRDGGKIILLAGAPQATGDDEERMLLSLRSIVEADPPLPVQVGVNGGHVFAGDVGPPYRRTYTVMGDAVNVAARLMARATAGQILSTTSVLDASLTVFQAKPVKPFKVKGKTAPVEAFVLGSAAGSRDDAVHELPLVGREVEMRTFVDALEGIRGGQGRLLELAGPPGIGKTRLVTELRGLAGGCKVVSAACELYSSSTPYHPFRQVLRSVLDLPATADPAVAAGHLQTRVEHESPELAPWLPFLAVPLDLELPTTTEAEEIAGEFRRSKIEESVVELLAHVLTAPTVIMFEDVHWMDEASADLLHRLVAECAARPWLICVTRRDETTGFVAHDSPHGVHLELTTLATDDAEALLLAATEEAPLRPYELEAIVERSGGNPLFLQELLRSARTSGSVHGLPDTIEALAVLQIDRLAPADRRLLRRASVLGVSFNDELLEALLDGELPDRSAWARLADLVLEEDRGLRRFRHALIRDAAYEGLPFSRRRELHARAGDALEQRGDMTVEQRAELLSLHYFHARRFERAWRYSRIAGDRASAKYAHVEAADFYRRALDAARHTGGVPSNDVVAVLEALADACDSVGAYDEAAAALRLARKRFPGDSVAAARLLRREAEIAERSGRYTQSLRLLGKALRSIDCVEGAEAARERARLATWYASGRMRQGRHREAAKWCERAIRTAEAGGDQATLAWAYMVLDTVSLELGLATSAEYGQIALAIYEELADLPRQATMTLNLGGRAYYEGRWPEALSLFERARDLYTRTGNTVSAADATFNIGEIRCHQGRLDEGEALLRDAVRVWRAAGDRVGVILATSELARASYRRGKCEDALPILEQARLDFHEAGAEAEVWETDLRIAECLLLGEDTTGALELLDESLGRVRSTGDVAAVAVSRVHRLRAWALVQQRRWDEAAEAFTESIGAARLRGAEYELALALDGLARLAPVSKRCRVEPLEVESREILSRLGVVSIPGVPELCQERGAPESAG